MHQLWRSGVSPEREIPRGPGAAADHCSFYPGSALQAFGDALKGYETARDGRFRASKPLPRPWCASL